MLRTVLLLGFLTFPSGSPGSRAHKHNLFLLQCLALQAQVTTLKEQNEQHIKEIEKNKSQMSGVEVATDASEKVSWLFEEANYVLPRIQKDCGPFVVLITSLALVMHLLSEVQVNPLEPVTFVVNPEGPILNF